MLSYEQTEVMGLGKEYHGGYVRFLTHHIRGPLISNDLLLVMLTLIAWLRWYLPGFSTVKFLFFPFYILFVRSKSLSPDHIQGKRY